MALVYPALSQGVVDGAEAPPAALVDQSHHELIRFYMKTNHIIDQGPIIMSQRAFDALKPDQQKIVMEEFQKGCDWYTQQAFAGYDAAIEKIRAKGVKIIDNVDRAAFAARAGTIVKAFPRWSPGLYEKVSAIVNAK